LGRTWEDWNSQEKSHLMSTAAGAVTGAHGNGSRGAVSS